MKLYKKNNQYIIEPVHLSLADEMMLDMGESLEVEIKIIDKRAMSDDQRKFIFKLCSIVDYETGIDKEMFRASMMTVHNNMYDLKLESLTQYSMSDASRLIDLIITFMIDKEIPIENSLLDKHQFSFNQAHTYQMCLKRVCVVCGRRAELHHVDAVGMGFDRKQISHVGKRMLPLCREHHHETHTIGNPKFIEKYHLNPAVVDKKLDYFIKRRKIKVFDGKE